MNHNNQNNAPPSISSTTANLPPTPTKVNAVVHTPSMFKTILFMAAFFMAFATVMTILLTYYDNTGNIKDHIIYIYKSVMLLLLIALKHHQFKVNMSQDYEFLNVAQDNPQLILYIKEVLMDPAKETHHKPFEPTIVINKDMTLIMDILKNKVCD